VQLGKQVCDPSGPTPHTPPFGHALLAQGCVQNLTGLTNDPCLSVSEMQDPDAHCELSPHDP